MTIFRVFRLFLVRKPPEMVQNHGFTFSLKNSMDKRIHTTQNIRISGNKYENTAKMGQKWPFSGFFRRFLVRTPPSRTQTCHFSHISNIFMQRNPNNTV